MDVDGCTFRWGTEQFLPGVLERLHEWQAAGNQIVFTTQRDGTWTGGLASMERTLKKEFPGCGIVTGVSSPRVLVNDAGAAAVNHQKNFSFHHDLLDIADRLRKRG